MTAPCGLPCFECYLYLAQFDEEMAETIADVLGLSKDEIKCKGCRAKMVNVPILQWNAGFTNVLKKLI